MDRRIRNYKLIVTTNDGQTIEIVPPITVEFDVQRKIFSQSSNCHFKIYNLSAATRNKLRRDYMDTGPNQTLRTVQLLAGYDNSQLTEIYRGNIVYAQSVRTGNNFITSIQSNELAFAQATKKYSKEWGAGVLVSAIVKDIISELKDYNILLGKICETGDKLIKTKTIEGWALPLLKDLCNNNFFVESGRANSMPMDKYILSNGKVISAKNGLISTPVLQQSAIQVDMIFEPSFSLGERVQVDSETFGNANPSVPNVYNLTNNPYYVIYEIKHKGIFAPFVNGEAITSLTLFGSARVGELQPL